MANKIIVLRDNDKRGLSDLEMMEEFYQFLQGIMPDKISVRHPVKLNKQKAFSIIWYLQEHLSVFPDTVEKCTVCGTLYDSEKEGSYSDKKGKFYCGICDPNY